MLTLSAISSWITAPQPCSTAGKVRGCTLSPRHTLGKRRHYQLLFYDELFDVIAEGVEVVSGGFVGEAG